MLPLRSANRLGIYSGTDERVILMVKMNNIEYSGYVNEDEDEITVVIATAEFLKDIVDKMTEVKEVIYSEVNSVEKTYVVTNPLSAATVSRNVYAIRFSTKPTPTQLLEAKSQEMSDAIDELLVMVLEG